MTTKAYSYIRFSTPTQTHGDSLRRQLALSQSYAQSKGLTLDESLTMKDLGVSAYRSKNSEQGALKAFLDALEEGKIEKGSYLLVESLDRLSRDRVATALQQFLGILNQGVIIVTLLDDGREYRHETLDLTELVISITIMSRAHEESMMKSRRIASRWLEKRDNAKNEIITRWSPKWLYANEDKTAWNVDEERAKIVKQIFTWASEGAGTSIIIQRLEKLGIEPWDYGEDISAPDRMPKKWHGSYIGRLLNSRKVLGEYQLAKANSEGQKEIIEDYYPRIIEDDLFFKVQNARSDRNVRKNGKGAGRKGKYVSNIFSGLIECGYSSDKEFVVSLGRCDGNNESVVLSDKGKGLKYLQCSRRKNGNIGCAGCRKYWRYDHFELSFLRHIQDIDTTDLIGKEDDYDLKIRSLRKTIEIKSAEKAKVENNIDKLNRAIEEYDKIPAFIINKGVQHETDLSKINAELKQLDSELAQELNQKNNLENSRTEICDLLNELNKKGDNEGLYEARLKLSDRMKNTIERISLFPNGRKLTDSQKTHIHDHMPDDFRQQVFARDIPFYIIEYKSGHQRIIMPDPKNPTELLIDTKYNDKEITHCSLNPDGYTSEEERLAWLYLLTGCEINFEESRRLTDLPS